MRGNKKMIKLLVLVALFPLFLSVFKGLWKTQGTQTRAVADTVELGAEIVNIGLTKSRKQLKKIK